MKRAITWIVAVALSVGVVFVIGRGLYGISKDRAAVDASNVPESAVFIEMADPTVTVLHLGAPLPVDRIQRTIESMEVDQEGWTVPWAMECSPYQCTVNINYPMFEGPDEVVTMKISRTEYGYIVDITETEGYLWTLDEEAEGGFIVEIVL